MRKCSHYTLIAILLICLGAFGQSETPGVLNKTPYEEIDVSIDFTERAAQGVTTPVITAFNLATSRDNTADIVMGSPAPFVTGMGKLVQFRLKGGFVGQKYNVKCQVIKADTTEKIEANVTLVIVSQQ